MWVDIKAVWHCGCEEYIIMEEYRNIIKTQIELAFNRAVVYIVNSKPAEPLLSMLNFGGYFFAYRRGCYGI